VCWPDRTYLIPLRQARFAFVTSCSVGSPATTEKGSSVVRRCCRLAMRQPLLSATQSSKHPLEEAWRSTRASWNQQRRHGWWRRMHGHRLRELFLITLRECQPPLNIMTARAHECAMLEACDRHGAIGHHAHQDHLSTTGHTAHRLPFYLLAHKRHFLWGRLRFSRPQALAGIGAVITLALRMAATAAGRLFRRNRKCDWLVAPSRNC
jgi:hypothetical protein